MSALDLSPNRHKAASTVMNAVVKIETNHFREKENLQIQA